MTQQLPKAASSPRVVFADANVLYARVLRDYLLYAATEGVIEIVWSRRVLDEMAEHLVQNIPGFTIDSAELLVEKMTSFYPDAEVNPEESDYEMLIEFLFPDEDDKHVFAAVLAAEADIICTSNKKHFPEEIASHFGVAIMSPDQLLCRMVKLEPKKMYVAHSDVVRFFPEGTDEGTLAALGKAGAVLASNLLREMHADHEKLS